jgi:hypothetical protein
VWWTLSPVILVDEVFGEMGARLVKERMVWRRGNSGKWEGGDDVGGLGLGGGDLGLKCVNFSEVSSKSPFFCALQVAASYLAYCPGGSDYLNSRSLQMLSLYKSVFGKFIRKMSKIQTIMAGGWASEVAVDRGGGRKWPCSVRGFQ